MEHGFLFVFNENGIQFAENGYDPGIVQEGEKNQQELIKQGLCIKIYLLFAAFIHVHTDTQREIERDAHCTVASGASTATCVSVIFI